jgi:Copine/C2 domain
MKIELSLYASQLKNRAGAFHGTSDPFCVATLLPTEPGKKPIVLGKTEVIPNSLSPHWVKVFVLDYELGTPLKVACNIFDQVKKGDNKTMGSAVFDIGELLGARGNTKAKKLKGGGTLFANVRKALGSGTLRLHAKGSKLKNVEGMFSKSDPFYELSRKISASGGLTWDNVYRSPHMKNTLNPDWEPAVIDLSILCGGDLDLPIKVEVFDHESSGKHKPMGSVEMSVKGMQSAAASGTPVTLLQKGKDVGSFHIVKAEVSGVESITNQLAATSVSPRTPYVPLPAAAAGAVNFVDYVSGGCELNVIVAIDFTGSNGDPRKPGTLHHLDANSMNPYEKAISAIVTILAKYDSDQKFPVYGFGAKYNGQINHCFRCGNLEEVTGVKGVLDAYDSVFKSGLIMSGPTVFTEVMEEAAARASSSLEAAQRLGKQTYTVLLILTDGEVSDVQATARCLDLISNAPLSVVIVGVGDADFSGMRFLDDAALKSGKRDIAQFVQFNQHSSNSTALTSETLREIPDQLVQCFQSRGIAPLPPLQRSDSFALANAGEAEEEINLSMDIQEDEIVILGGGDDFVEGFAKYR